MLRSFVSFPAVPQAEKPGKEKQKMNRIAFILGDRFLYWNSIFLTLGAVCSICMFLALALRKREDIKAAVIAVPVAFACSLLISRLFHWYCRPLVYTGFSAAMTDYSRGGYALIGVFAGCLLTALLLYFLKICRNLPRFLDYMAVSGALGIAAGRLGALFTDADRGMVLPGYVPFPFACPLYNSVSGENEQRLAVFMLQSIIAFVLFLFLLISYLQGKKRHTLKDGDTCLTFLLWYCASQAVLDSPRYDSLYFRFNGFVSVVQIFSMVTVVTVLVIFAVRLRKSGRWSKYWLIAAPLPFLGLAGYMEYYVQRHGARALFAYSIMSISMLAAVLLILFIRRNAVPVRRFSDTGKPESFAPAENLSFDLTPEDEEISWEWKLEEDPRLNPWKKRK